MNYRNFREVSGTKLYRGSKPDVLDQKQVGHLGNSGIKCIIDLRSRAETTLADVPVDRKYEAVKLADSKKSQPVFVGMKPGRYEKRDYDGKHYLIELSLDVETAIYRRCRWYFKIILTLLWIIDYLFGSFLYGRACVLGTIRKNGLLGLYCDNIVHCGERIKAALTLLCSEERVPALICCSYGKDRTGILSAMVQVLCGVPEETIAREYALSEDLVSEMFDKRIYGKQEFTEAKPETILSLLRFIDHKYGSLPKYLETIGFSSTLQNTLIENIKANGAT